MTRKVRAFEKLQVRLNKQTGNHYCFLKINKRSFMPAKSTKPYIRTSTKISIFSFIFQTPPAGEQEPFDLQKNSLTAQEVESGEAIIFWRF